MATWDDVDRLASSLPDTVTAGRAWRVHGKLFVWERPLRARDLDELGDAAPAEAPLAFRVADEGEKLALVDDSSGSFFTTSHFDGYPIVLARLERLQVTELRELLQDSWLARAPKRLAAQLLRDTEEDAD